MTLYSSRGRQWHRWAKGASRLLQGSGLSRNNPRAMLTGTIYAKLLLTQQLLRLRNSPSAPMPTRPCPRAHLTWARRHGIATRHAGIRARAQTHEGTGIRARRRGDAETRARTWTQTRTCAAAMRACYVHAQVGMGKVYGKMVWARAHGGHGRGG